MIPGIPQIKSALNFSSMEFGFVMFAPKYMNHSTFSGDLLPVVML
jgi:hypothetical protein